MEKKGGGGGGDRKGQGNFEELKKSKNLKAEKTSIEQNLEFAMRGKKNMSCSSVIHLDKIQSFSKLKFIFPPDLSKTF